jgi:predicted ATPase with chaperone activity
MLCALDSGEPAHVIRARVEAARQVQQARFTELGKPTVLVNGDMGPDEVQKFCARDETGRLSKRERGIPFSRGRS